MSRTLVLAVALGGLAVGSSAFAGFSLAYTRSSLNATQDAVLIRALNDGDTTGTKLHTFSLNFNIQAGNPSFGSKAYFFVDDTDFDGTPDQVQLPNSSGNATGGYLRIGTAADTFIISSSPTKGVVQPNPWVGGVSSFGVTATSLSDPTANTGTGALFARLIIDKNAGVAVTGTMGGDTGPAVSPTANVLLPVGPVTAATFGVASGGAFSFNSPSLGTATVSGGGSAGADLYNVNVAFKNAAAAGVAFSFNTNASSGVIQIGTLPAGITATASGSVISGTISGTVRGTLDIPITLNGNEDTGVLRFVAIPEPTLLAGVACAALLGPRRRHTRGS